MKMEIERSRCMALVKLTGELDHHACEKIREDLDGILRMSSTKAMVLDMSGVSFMDSSGMGLLLARSRLAADRGVSLVIAGATPEVGKLICMVSLDKQVPLFDTAEQALEYVKNEREQVRING